MPKHEEFMEDVDTGDDNQGFHVPDTGEDLEAIVGQDDQNQDDLELVVEDDTPEEDRGRKPLGKDALAEDDEAIAFNDKFKKRIGELRHQAHDERRAKEAALREREEAVRFAQEAYRRAKELEQQLQAGRSSYAKTYAEKAQAMLSAAKEKHRKAYEAGDSDAMADAAGEIAQAQNELQQAKYWEQEAEISAQRALQTQEDEVDFDQPRPQSVQQQPAPVEPDPLAVEWTKQNKWFGKNAKMTAFAYGVHEDLVMSGIHPAEDAEIYYKTIDDEMRLRFPEYEWDKVDSGKGQRTSRNTPTQRKTSSPVAPVARTTSGNKTNRVVLTRTQLRIAEEMGLTPQQYAIELRKLEKGE